MADRFKFAEVRQEVIENVKERLVWDRAVKMKY